MRKIEAGASADEPVLESDEATRWTGPTVSGGAESLVPWGTLGREGRRHALTFVRPQPFPDRPYGVPDLSIETVMGEPARATPAHVYVSLDSAPTARERADLALAEMERVGPSTARLSCWSPPPERATSTTWPWPPRATSPSATWPRSPCSTPSVPRHCRWAT